MVGGCVWGWEWGIVWEVWGEGRVCGVPWGAAGALFYAIIQDLAAKKRFEANHVPDVHHSFRFAETSVLFRCNADLVRCLGLLRIRPVIQPGVPSQ